MQTSATGQADSFVRYRLPNSHETQHLRGHAERLDRCERPLQGFMVAPFHETADSPAVIILPCKEENETATNGTHAVTPQTSSLPSLTYRPAHPQQPNYATTFATFAHALQTAAFQKLVLAHPFPALSVKAEELFERLERQHPESFVYLLSTPYTGTWVGASPEVLLETDCHGAHTVALAGTKQSAEAWDEKNRSEQSIVSDYVRQVLHEQGITCEEQPTENLCTGLLQHLCTHFRFARPRNLVAMAQALHPTPAVCGLPKDEAQRFILQHEGFDRRYYSGYLGPIDECADTHLYVNIRCAELHAEEGATLYAGGGLLASSQLEDEWQELLRKKETIC